MELEKTPGIQGLSKPGRQASRLRSSERAFIAIAVVVVILLTSSIAVVSNSTVSRLTITLTNNSDEDRRVRVWVDEFEDVGTLLGPWESISYHWNISGWPVHRYFVMSHDADSLIMFFIQWTHVVVFPFTERSLAFEANSPVYSGERR